MWSLEEDDERGDQAFWERGRVVDGKMTAQILVSAKVTGYVLYTNSTTSNWRLPDQAKMEENSKIESTLLEFEEREDGQTVLQNLRMLYQDS